MEVCIVDIQHAGFVVLLHSAGTVELPIGARFHGGGGILCYEEWIQVVCTRLWIPSRHDLRKKKSWSHKASCCSPLIVFAQQKTKRTEEKSWDVQVFYLLCPWGWKREPYGGNELTERTSAASLEFNERESVCVHLAPESYTITHCCCSVAGSGWTACSRRETDTHNYTHNACTRLGYDVSSTHGWQFPIIKWWVFQEVHLGNSPEQQVY